VSIISVRDLTKNFGPVQAVRGVSFDVEPGEIFAFLGPNGAGKSTTIKMLTTLLHPTTGTISVNGHDPMQDASSVRRSFGIVFQDPSLDDELTARENLDLHGVLYGVPKKTRIERTDQLLQFVDLWDRRNDYVKTFSGGMKRRLEIARGLLHHPKILFLDEPTLGLDPQTRNHLWNYVSRLNSEEHMTIFFTTHYMEEAQRIAQRVAIVDHGQIVAQGSPEQLATDTGTTSLEEAFMKQTGSAIREEEATSADHMREGARMWRRR
jgi:ABC-2 type transport system ATP-binding protein